MIAEFGYGILVLSFLVVLYGAGAAAFGALKNSTPAVESARRAMLLTWPLITLSAFALITLLIRNHYEVSFVYEVTSRSMPAYLKVTAWWGGQAGSLIFWSWLMSAFASLVTLRKWERDREFLPWVIVVLSLTIAFFLMLSVFFENPFTRYWQTADDQVVTSMLPPENAVLLTPPDGQGLNPLLRHPGMIIHPPMLYLGFVSFVVPYAFAMAALITGRADDRWIRITRRWTLWAWLFLSFGLVLGGRWAYDVLGWGGYWGWDPVEIAAFLPWLTGTAFLHSVMIQEKRGLFKHWNMVLIILTYALVIFGTFLTRSGVLSSVHSFAQSAIGPLFFVFITITFTVSIALVIRRWPELQSETEMKSMLSRESLFLFNNLLFMSILVVCFWGVIYPLITELTADTVCQWFPALTNYFECEKQVVGPPFYEQTAGPLFAILMVLMSVAPFSAWGLSSADNMGKINRLILGGILAVPVLVFMIFRGPIVAELGSRALALIMLAVILLILTFLYIFRRSVWPATLIAALVTTVIALTYTRNLYALIGFFLVALALSATVRDFWRATRARQRAQQESFIEALSRLTARNRRRYGGYIIHISMALMAIGILGIELFQKETQGTVPVGGTLNVSGYTVQYDEIASFPAADQRQVTRAVVSIYKNGEYLGQLYPRIDFYPDAEQTMTIPGQRSTLVDDLYILLVDWQPVSAVGATFKIYVNPLVNWLWIGSLVFIFGILIAAWPDREPEYAAARAAQRVEAQPSAAD
jgi:cytochrome c-type biogenesis protein CcmF